MIMAFLIVLGMVLVINAIFSIGDGNWEIAGISIAIVLIVIWFCSGTDEQATAYNNRIKYWATGKKPWDDDDEIDIETKMDEPPRQQIIYPQYHQEVFQCPQCGKHVQAVSTLTNVNGVQMWQFNCPQCGTMIRRIGH